MREICGGGTAVTKCCQDTVPDEHMHTAYYSTHSHTHTIQCMHCVCNDGHFADSEDLKLPLQILANKWRQNYTIVC